LLPGWQRQPGNALPYGGARPWDEVAQTVLTAIQRHARVPGGVREPAGDQRLATAA
jgi:hypothetical protein